MADRSSRRLYAVLAALGTTLALVLSGCAGANAAATNSDGYQPPPVKHVWTIILENKSYEASFTGLNQNSYLWKTLPRSGELLRQYYGTGHNSLDNYISMIGGQAPTPDTQNDCPQYKDVAPGTVAPDGQVNAQNGCVYPASVPTLFNQLDAAGVPWKGYMQDMGRQPGREQPTCGAPGNPAGAGVPDPGSATATDQYVPKHNPFVWFHSVTDSPECGQRVVPLDALAADLKQEATTPAFSWITPDNCSDAHDATCKGDNLSGDPTNHQGGLFAADLFLQRVIPMIMASPAFQDNGLIDITFDEAFPPYKAYDNSIADYAGNADPKLNTPTDTAQSVISCCNELPGPNTANPGFQAFGQDTTPGGGVTGSVLISRYIHPGTVSDQPYNHYSWLRSMEDLFGVASGGTDGHGHIGYAGMNGLRPFGPDVYNNPDGVAGPPAAATGAGGLYPARQDAVADEPRTLTPVSYR